MERLLYTDWRRFAVLFTALTLAAGSPGVRAQDAAIADYKENCESCHTIGGGRRTGPDLKNVEERKDRDWLVRFIVDPQGVLGSGDPYALKLKEDAGGAVMPNVAKMTREKAEALLDLIAAESKLERSQFVGVQIDRALTAADIEKGKGIFNGTVPLEKEGVSCISCHVVTGIGGLGGGQLGPDLTKIFERRQGRKGLVAWLKAPATPVMQATFRGHPLDEDREILPLVAYFRETAKLDEHSHAPATLTFIILGVAGTIGVLILFGWIWSFRFRSVRATLLQKRPAGEPV